MARTLAAREFWAGLMFAAFGAAFVWFGRDYGMGSAARMGPAYLPIVLGAVLVVLGGTLSATAFVKASEPLDKLDLRPLLVIVLAIVLYGWLLRPIGLVFSTAIVVLGISIVAGRTPLRLAALLAVALAATAALVFVLGLGIPINLWPRF